ncbi:hypothetical protein GCM10027053_18620 [Intrasporangium mesophilum]
MARIEDERTLLPYLLAAFPTREGQIRQRAMLEEYATYDIVGGIRWDVLGPALESGGRALLGKCFKVIEELFTEGAELVAGAIHFRITPYLIPWEDQYADLMGPVLREDLAILTGR